VHEVQQKCTADSGADTQATAPAGALPLLAAAAANTAKRLPARPAPSREFLPAETVGNGIPQGFVMKNTTKFADPMLAFSDRDGAELGGRAGSRALVVQQ
jgi:hypothetical protein